MTEKYTVSEEKKKQFAGIYLLEYMINTPKAISIFLDKNDQDLEPVLEWLMAKNYIEIKDQEKYIPTQKGRELLQRFMARYSEYLTMFDIFSAVDLADGEFAFATYFDFEDDQAWNKFLNNERWEDLRVAVAKFKKMDPLEIVFMSFISERRFGRDKSGWQFDLLLGTVWDEILKICNTALAEDDLSYEDDEGTVSGHDVLIDIIKQGSEIMIGLLDKEAEMMRERICFASSINDEKDKEYYVDKVDVPNYPPNHYHVYRDPYYISPAWMLLLLL